MIALNTQIKCSRRHVTRDMTVRYCGYFLGIAFGEEESD